MIVNCSVSLAVPKNHTPVILRNLARASENFAEQCRSTSRFAWASEALDRARAYRALADGHTIVTTAA